MAASLTEGQLIRDAGLSETPATLVLAMAERASSGLAARLAMLLDRSNEHALILLDEGADPEEMLTARLVTVWSATTESVDQFLHHLRG